MNSTLNDSLDQVKSWIPTETETQKELLKAYRQVLNTRPKLQWKGDALQEKDIDQIDSPTTNANANSNANASKHRKHIHRHHHRKKAHITNSQEEYMKLIIRSEKKPIEIIKDPIKTSDLFLLPKAVDTLSFTNPQSMQPSTSLPDLMNVIPTKKHKHVYRHHHHKHHRKHHSKTGIEEMDVKGSGILVRDTANDEESEASTNDELVKAVEALLESQKSTSNETIGALLPSLPPPEKKKAMINEFFISRRSSMANKRHSLKMTAPLGFEMNVIDVDEMIPNQPMVVEIPEGSKSDKELIKALSRRGSIVIPMSSSRRVSINPDQGQEDEQVHFSRRGSNISTIRRGSKLSSPDNTGFSSISRRGSNMSSKPRKMSTLRRPSSLKPINNDSLDIPKRRESMIKANSDRRKSFNKTDDNFTKSRRGSMAPPEDEKHEIIKKKWAKAGSEILSKIKSKDLDPNDELNVPLGFDNDSRENLDIQTQNANQQILNVNEFSVKIYCRPQIRWLMFLYAALRVNKIVDPWFKMKAPANTTLPYITPFDRENFRAALEVIDIIKIPIHLREDRDLEILDSYLATKRFFSKFPSVLRMKLYNECNLIHYCRGTTLVKEGSYADKCYILLFGECVQFSKASINQTNPILTINEMGVSIGDFTSILANERRSYSIMTSMRCTFLGIHKQDWVRIVKEAKLYETYQLEILAANPLFQNIPKVDLAKLSNKG